jgi:hypothetical protein
MIVAGVLTLAGTGLLHLALGRRIATIPIAARRRRAARRDLPGPTGTPHAGAMLAFVAGGFARVLAAASVPRRSGTSRRCSVAPFCSRSAQHALGEEGPLSGLRYRRLERWIAYPVVIWMIAFGGWLLGRASGARRTDPSGDGLRVSRIRRGCPGTCA